MLVVAPITLKILTKWKSLRLRSFAVYVDFNRNKNNIELSDLTINVLYTAQSATKATQLKEALELNGITVNIKQSDNIHKDYIAVHNLDIAGETINDLKKVVPEIKDRHTVYDPISIGHGNSDLTVVIAK